MYTKVYATESKGTAVMWIQILQAVLVLLTLIMFKVECELINTHNFGLNFIAKLSRPKLPDNQ